MTTLGIISVLESAREKKLPFRRVAWAKHILLRISETTGYIINHFSGDNVAMNADDIMSNDWHVVAQSVNVDDGDVFTHKGTAYLYTGGKFYPINSTPKDGFENGQLTGVFKV